MLRISARAYSNHVNPRIFKQLLQLTDGSCTTISSLSPSRPFVKLNIDSLSHPSWNPKLRDILLLSDHGEVAKFRSRFGADESAFSDAATLFKGDVRKVASQSPSEKQKHVKRKK